MIKTLLYPKRNESKLITVTIVKNKKWDEVTNTNSPTGSNELRL